eukprot:5512125-Pleurochrysis_carterae.AAC.1
MERDLVTLLGIDSSLESRFVLTQYAQMTLSPIIRRDGRGVSGREGASTDLRRQEWGKGSEKSELDERSCLRGSVRARVCDKSETLVESV